METLYINSINFQTRIFLLRVMGDQDLMVLMPHGNWSWRPFSQLANQLTTCRQKTTGTYFAGDSDSDASNLGRLSHGRVSRAPWIDLTLASASWQSCWFGQLAVRCPLPSLLWQSSDSWPTKNRPHPTQLTRDTPLKLQNHSWRNHRPTNMVVLRRILIWLFRWKYQFLLALRAQRIHEKRYQNDFQQA